MRLEKTEELVYTISELPERGVFKVYFHKTGELREYTSIVTLLRGLVHIEKRR